MNEFDTLISEIQSLKAEVLSLREQNVSRYNELEKNLTALKAALGSIKRADKTFSADLQVYLTRLAGMQTAEFILKNMSSVKYFNNGNKNLARNSYMLYSLEQVKVSEGGYLEFGVASGRSINVISSANPDKIVYGFDSFEGLPEDWTGSLKKGAFSREGELPSVNKNVRLVKGWFNETLPEFVKVHPEPCAFIHVDCDLYSSAKTIFNELRNQIVSGTIIAFDEYFNYPGWQEGEYKAFMEFIAWSGLEFEYIARTNFEQVAVRII